MLMGYGLYVGFLVSLGTILLCPIATLIGLAAFTNWITALVFLVALAVFSYVAVKRHAKYHRAEKYNDQNWKRDSRW